MTSTYKKPACHPRRRFTTRENAQAAAVKISNTGGPHRLPETCPHCMGWHLR